MITTFAKMLPERQQLFVARWRFQRVREDFYRETRLDIAVKGLRNTETLFDRLETYEKRSRSRGKLEWRVFARIRETMQRGESFALAIKPFVPGDEYALLDIADESSREDAVVRGFELAEMAAKAKRVLSSTTSVLMAYPALLLIYMYAYCMLFGGVIFPQVLDVRPLDQWPDLGRFLYYVDTFCYEYWWLTLTAMIGLVLAYFSSLKRWAGPLRDRFDRTPLFWRNRRDLRAALLIVSLAGLFDSNLTLRAALERLLKTADPWLRWHLKIMDRRLTARSDEPMRALDTGIFSVTIVDTITDAAGRDQFEAAIKSLGRESLDRVVEAVKRNARTTHFILLGFAAALFLTLGIGSYVVTGAVNLTSGNPAASSY
ncbi:MULTISPECIES: type II secretion system protein [unclassified Caballeronia]|uniref:type II secretion system protein n=1 Tax=unclassified Caballeronia TaxID=2646786 RepID=UPI001F42B2CA|nr:MULTISPECIES: type II secretion system protein [unclassified Caballeronia]MCE4547639.1 type II secretion system protein [Caballeronia sp. PC1]MCE4575097.1 type II secretion system protein [Caballeronia sp. CLC5]